MTPFLPVFWPLSSLACLLLASAVLADERLGVRVIEHQLEPSFVQEFVPTKEGRLSCYRRVGSGPSLLLIPGTWSDSRVYVATVARLDPALDILLLENRGLGGSWPPPERSSIKQCAVDALTVLDALKVTSCYVGGHSLGGMIALELGQRAPRRIRGVIAIEGWTNHRAAKAFQTGMCPTLSPEQLAARNEYKQECLKNWSPEQKAMFGQIWRQWDGSQFLRTTQLPVLELYGDRSQARPAIEDLGIPSRKNIEVVWFSGASHPLLMERPREVAEALNRFIAAQEKSSGSRPSS